MLIATISFVRSLLVISAVQLTLISAKPAVQMDPSVSIQNSIQPNIQAEPICPTQSINITLFHDKSNEVWTKEAVLEAPEELQVEIAQCVSTGLVEKLKINDRNVVCQQDYIYLGTSRLPLEVSCSVRLTT